MVSMNLSQGLAPPSFFTFSGFSSALYFDCFQSNLLAAPDVSSAGQNYFQLKASCSGALLIIRLRGRKIEKGCANAMRETEVE